MQYTLNLCTFFVAVFGSAILSSCVKMGEKKEDVEAPPVVVTAKNFRDAKVRCATSAEGSSFTHQVQCNAVINSEGLERPIIEVEPGVRFEWKDLIRVAGVEPKSIDCMVSPSGITQSCRVKLNAAEPVTLRSTLSVTEVATGEKVTSEAEVVLPFSVRTYGQLLELPVSFSPPSENSVNPQRASASRNAVETEPEALPARLVEHDFNAFDSNLVANDVPMHVCSLGNKVYVSVYQFVYAFANGRMKLHAGSPIGDLVKLPDAKMSRRRIQFSDYPAITCAEGNSESGGVIYVLSIRFSKEKGATPQLLATELRGDEAFTSILPIPDVRTAYARVSALSVSTTGDWIFSIYDSHPTYSLSAVYRYRPGQGVSRIAGGLSLGNEGDNGPAASASFGYLSDLAVTNSGKVLLVDYTNKRLRQLSLDGVVAPFAGDYAFQIPRGIAVYKDKAYLSDWRGKLLEIDPEGQTVIEVATDWKAVATNVYGELHISNSGILTAMVKGFRVGRLGLNAKPLKWEWVGGTSARETSLTNSIPIDLVKFRNILSLGESNGKVTLFELGRDLTTEVSSDERGQTVAKGFLELTPTETAVRSYRATFLPDGSVIAALDRPVTKKDGTLVYSRIVQIASNGGTTDLICHENETNCSESATRTRLGEVVHLASGATGELLVLDFQAGMYRILRLGQDVDGTRKLSVLLDSTGFIAFQRKAGITFLSTALRMVQSGPSGQVFFVADAVGNNTKEGRLFSLDASGVLHLIGGTGKTPFVATSSESNVKNLQVVFEHISVTENGDIYGTDSVNRHLFVLHPSKDQDKEFSFELLAKMPNSFHDCGFGVVEKETSTGKVLSEWKATLGQVCIGDITAFKAVDRCHLPEKKISLLIAQKFTQQGRGTILETTRPCL